MFFNITDHSLDLCLDYDGCTDTIKAQTYLINYVIQLLKTYPQITTINVSIGSTRAATFLNDFHTAHSHHLSSNAQKPYQSCVALNTEFIFALNHQLFLNSLDDQVQVNFDPLMLSDVLNDFPDGHNFYQMLACHKNYSQWASGAMAVKLENINRTGKVVTFIELTANPTFDPQKPLSRDNNPIHYRNVNSVNTNDEYKILLNYMRLQEGAAKLLASENPTHTSVLHFWDDRDDITYYAWAFFKANSQLIPDNYRLRIEQFCIASVNSILPKEFDAAEAHTIIGTGPVNPHYADDIRSVAAKLHEFEREFINIYLAETAMNNELKKAQEELPFLTIATADLMVIENRYNDLVKQYQISYQTMLNLRSSFTQSRTMKGSDVFEIIAILLLEQHAKRFPPKPPSPPIEALAMSVSSTATTNSASSDVSEVRLSDSMSVVTLFDT